MVHFYGAIFGVTPLLFLFTFTVLKIAIWIFSIFSPFMFHRERKSNQHFWMNYPLSLLPSESPREFPIAISSKQVREVLRSEVSKSVPVTNQATAIETKCSQVAAVYQRLKEGEINQQPAEEVIQIDPAKPGLLCCFLVTADNNTSGIFYIFQLVIFTLSMCIFFFPASPQSNLRSIMKRKADGEPGSPYTKKNLQFIGVNGG